MPTRITKPDDLPDVPAGVACVNCWGFGKPFGSGSTPESIELTVEGVVPGPLWVPGNGSLPDGTYTLDQLGGAPCFYEANPLLMVSLFVRFNADNTFIELYSTTFVLAFQSLGGSPCSTVRSNQLDDFFMGGTVTIRIPGAS